MPDEPRQRDPRQLDADYINYIRGCTCCVCGDDVSVEPHHLRVGVVNGPDHGAGLKSSDRWAVPLCGRHHREAHAEGDRMFWAKRGIDPVAMSMHYQRSPR